MDDPVRSMETRKRRGKWRIVAGSLIRILEAGQPVCLA